MGDSRKGCSGSRRFNWTSDCILLRVQRKKCCCTGGQSVSLQLPHDKEQHIFDVFPLNTGTRIGSSWSSASKGPSPSALCVQVQLHQIYYFSTHELNIRTGGEAAGHYEGLPADLSHHQNSVPEPQLPKDVTAALTTSLKRIGMKINSTIFEIQKKLFVVCMV